MNNARTCPNCGGPLPADILDGLCARCVARVSLATPSDEVSPVKAPPAERTRVRYFGDHELLEELAHGGIHVVYQARQVRRLNHWFG